MGYIIEADEGNAWAAANWVYAEILTLIEPHLALAASSSLRKALDDPRVAAERVLRLMGIPLEEVRAFLRAARAGMSDMERAGGASFASPESYPGFVDRFRELIELLDAFVERDQDAPSA